MINNVAKLLKVQGIELSIDESVKELVAKKGTDKAFGARPLKRTIQTMIEDKIADYMLEGKTRKSIKVSSKDEEIIVK